jgi:long-chain-fatty-acid--[acyl-carrier-protein] ligase
VATLEARGTGVGVPDDGLVFIEDVAARLGLCAKAGAWARTRLGLGALRKAAVSQTAAILFTSGSEALPKAVPLTHANLLSNTRDVCEQVGLRCTERLVGFLPPFHSFGLTATVVLPLCTGIPVVHHPDPTKSGTIAQIIEAYGVTVLPTTPTFLRGILRASGGRRLDALRLVVTGGEACPAPLYAEAAERCPQAAVLEGYGITECSPVVSVNTTDDPRPGTIGRPVPSVRCAVVDPGAGCPVAEGETGMLLVRGPGIFGGYVGGSTGNPFVEHEGERWYRTGDLVSRDRDGVLTFRGRLRRFVKLGGEMISLPAIEGVLSDMCEAPAANGPSLAVEATPDEGSPEIVLFTTLPLERADANSCIRAAGLSALHNIRWVVHLDEIPVLGTGKTDYRALRARLANGMAQSADQAVAANIEGEDN